MGRAPNRIRLAERLLEMARAEAQANADRDPAAIVCARLAAVLTAFASASGARALLRRALVLATAKSPSLAAVEFAADGTLSGFDAIDGETRTAAGEALVRELLDLLSELIGEALVWRLASKAWPDSTDAVREGDSEGTA